MDVTIIVVSVSLASSIVAIVMGFIKMLQFVSDRPKREEVHQIVDRSLEAVNQKVQSIKDNVDYIRTWIDNTKKRK